jgi:arylformamidase
VPQDPFRIRDHVANFDDIVADLVRRSEATRAAVPMVADVAYGPGPFETLDLFFPPQARSRLPVHLFIHGGYWRMFSKRDYSCIADTVVGTGAIAAIVDYALMPAVRMSTIVDQVRRAAQWINSRIGEYGGDPARLTVSGHSAGAHLATFLFDERATSPNVRAALLLGGIYDLKPLQNSFLSAEIAITDQEAAAFSPLTRRHSPLAQATILVGADETPPFHIQADAFTIRLRQQGLAVSRWTVPGNHMTSVNDLAVAGTRASRYLAELIAG